MISSTAFSEELKRLDFDTAAGVPDSTFKGLISFFSSSDVFTHVTASNECEAMGISTGYYLAHGKPSIVYMQNSGFLQNIEPLHLHDGRRVYSIPNLMLVGWRGEPGKKDEPQHLMMGRIMTDLLKLMELEFLILEESQWKEQLAQAKNYLDTHQRPFVIIIKKGLFDDYTPPEVNTDRNEATAADQEELMSREQAIEIIIRNIPKDSVVVSTTGKTSRELFELRARNNQPHGTDFYTVGSMGCASSIAFGVGLAKSDKQVFILDGDGAALMQLGAMATIGHYRNSRIKHILLDNNAHESTGSQPTVSNSVDFTGIARSCGYDEVHHAANEEELETALKRLHSNDNLSFLLVKIKTGARPDLGRPTTTPKENRDAFIRHFKGL